MHSKALEAESSLSKDFKIRSRVRLSSEIIQILHFISYTVLPGHVLSHHGDESSSERRPDGRRVRDLGIIVPQPGMHRQGGEDCSLASAHLVGLESAYNARPLPCVHLYSGLTISIIDIYRSALVLYLQATPRLKMALVNSGFSSNARRYASTASSGLPPFANVAPSLFHSR